MRTKKGLAFLLSLSLILSAVIIVSPKLASAESMTISLGADVIENGDAVWFGHYKGEPIFWRVLSDGSDARLPVSGTGEALLFTLDVLDDIYFITDPADDQATKHWSGSYAQAWCTSFLDNWTDGSAEKDAIKQTSVTETNDKEIIDTQDGAVPLEDAYYYLGGRLDDYYCAASLNNESFFFLSAQEADTYFTDDDDRVVRDPAPWLENSWWLRSPSGFEYGVGWVNEYGEVESVWFGLYEEGSDYGARPAFNLDLSHVLFSSKLPQYAGSVYKLTLIDANKTIGIPSEKTLTRDNSTSVTVPFAKDSDSDHVSLLITNKEDTWSDTTGWSSGAVKQYYTTRKVSEDTGTVTFALPDDYETNKSNWKVWILAEKVNDEYSSDDACAPLEIAIPDVPQR